MTVTAKVKVRLRSMVEVYRYEGRTESNEQQFFVK